VTASILLDLSLAAAVLGALGLVKPLAFLGMHSRASGAALLVGGIAAALIVALWPAPALHSSGHQAIDRYLSSYNFHEFHTTRVNAPREAVYHAVLEVTADEIRWFKPLMAIRTFPAWLFRKRSPRPTSLPILEVATRASFFYLAKEPPREIVVGTVGQFWKLAGGTPPPGPKSPEAFVALDDSSYAKAVMNFVIEDSGGGTTLLTTETRILAPEGEARRRFAAYWRLIYPGSSLIRVGWLEGIKRRAEAPAAPPST
jgi:hypothetical protein